MASAIKNPVKQRAGAIGAQRRWAGHTASVVRLDDLTPPQRRLVVALIDAARGEFNEKAIAGVSETSPAMARRTEGTTDADRSS